MHFCVLFDLLHAKKNTEDVEKPQSFSSSDLDFGKDGLFKRMDGGCLI